MYISALLYRNSLILTAVALIISVIINELNTRSAEDFPRDGPEWVKNLIKFLLSKEPISKLINFNTQVRLIIFNVHFFKLKLLHLKSNSILGSRTSNRR